jgi:hypothetical protein
MRICSNQPFHLTYCTNIHPGEQWQDVKANLRNYIPALKSRLSPDKPFGIGLRLSSSAAQELLIGDRLSQFKLWLDQQDCYVFTLNGFPYGGFHHQIVKDQVYAPDWTKPERLDYTLQLVEILAALLPEGIDGGISTLPLSYKPWWTIDRTATQSVLHQSALNLAKVAAAMIQHQRNTGKVLHLDLEPEPDGLMENTAEAIGFFRDWLFPVGGTWLAEHLGVSLAVAESHLREHIRICYDTCHFAVAYEQPAAALAQFAAAGIQIGKVQISAAIQVKLPADRQQRQQVKTRLQPFAESTYLHQVIERHANGTLQHYPDLIAALPFLDPLDQTAAQEWRIHFHVPIFIQNYQLLESTQDHIVALLDLLRVNPICQHLEIETYTWDVLPSGMKLDLLTSIQREYEWVLSTIAPQLTPQPDRIHS